METSSIVLVHLIEPNEKYWGILDRLSSAGITVRAINLSSFDDWMGSIVNDDEPAFGVSTLFFPMRRIERISLDEPMGEIESLSQMFERRVGRSIVDVLDMATRSLMPPDEPPDTTH